MIFEFLWTKLVFFGRTRPETVSKPVFFKIKFFTKKKRIEKKNLFEYVFFLTDSTVEICEWYFYFGIGQKCLKKKNESEYVFFSDRIFTSFDVESWITSLWQIPARNFKHDSCYLDFTKSSSRKVKNSLLYESYRGQARSSPEKYW